MKVTILETEYFPCISWFAAYTSAESVCLPKKENFVRSSYRNRCDLAGPNGRMRISVPLQGGRNAQRQTCDVRISYDTRWALNHLRTIESAYRRTPFYLHYEDDIHHFFSQRHSFLVDLNQYALRMLLRMLNLPDKFQDTEIDSTYFTPRFSPVIEQQSNYSPYLQPFGERQGFLSGLSILDPLFCLGPAGTLSYLGKLATV